MIKSKDTVSKIKTTTYYKGWFLWLKPLNFEWLLLHIIPSCKNPQIFVAHLCNSNCLLLRNIFSFKFKAKSDLQFNFYKSVKDSTFNFWLLLKGCYHFIFSQNIYPFPNYINATGIHPSYSIFVPLLKITCKTFTALTM